MMLSCGGPQTFPRQQLNHTVILVDDSRLLIEADIERAGRRRFDRSGKRAGNPALILSRMRSQSTAGERLSG